MAGNEEAGDAGPQESQEHERTDFYGSGGSGSQFQMALNDKSEGSAVMSFGRGSRGIPVVVADSTKIAAATRWKPALDRSLDEKRWVAIDKKMLG